MNNGVHFSRHKHTFIPIIFFLLALLLPGVAAPEESKTAITYNLAISFNLENEELIGTAQIHLPPQQGITLHFHDIQPTGIILNKSLDAPTIYSPEELEQISVIPDARAQVLLVSYTKKVTAGFDNFITNKGITLLNNWHPLPSKRVLFDLQATLPEGFTALAESDHLPADGSGPVHFTFSTPVRNIHFTAAPFVIAEEVVRPGLKIFTYLFPDEQHLAAGYLEAAAGFLLRYEEMIGPYPYNHFVIAENLQPTGYGMPTFTLLGRQVIRLPFIKDTSLGHEILHSWFGNGIEVDYSQGNWSEGLTTYLADWLYRTEKGEGAANRKEQLIKYHSFVNEKNSRPLESFTSAHHNQPMAQAVRSVGYIKGAMFFHELRNLIGDQAFFAGIRQFYHDFRGKEAGWSELQTVFTESSGRDLDLFFSERLQRSDIPDLEITKVDVDNSPGSTALRLTIRQTNQQPFQLRLPIQVDSTNWSGRFIHELNLTEEEIFLPLRSPATRITIDPEYDFLRTLVIDEMVPTVGHFLGSSQVLVVINPDEKDLYHGLIEFARDHSWPVKTTSALSGLEMRSKDLVLPGKNNQVGLSLFGPLNLPEQGIALQARRHPLSETNNVLQLSLGKDENLATVLPRLRHFGKYSSLHFLKGRLAAKSITSSQSGIELEFAKEPEALPSRALTSFHDAMDTLAAADIIYVGESHTSMKDHHLQYLVLEKLFKEQKNIVIGMEMFPASSQEVLDRYTSATQTMSEQEFLKASRYFEVWGYDYRYYKQIFDFARKHAIPVIGLNIEREIVSSVYKHGSTAMLTKAQQDLLPRERDLSLPGYFERLRRIHGFHPHGGSGGAGLSGFIQAQAVWDEVMAVNIVNSLRKHPESTMVVLAGREHARKDSGIPPRVARRHDLIQQVVMTVDERSGPAPDQADFFFYLEERQLPPAGKIGISVEKRQNEGGSFLEIVSLRKESHAPEAGLFIGDRIMEVDGFKVESRDDIRVALAGKRAGDKVNLSISRDVSGIATVENLTVELYDPEQSK